MYTSIFLASLGFIAFFIWYLAAENAATRRAAGLGAIVASLLTCGIALYPIDKTIRLGLDLQGGTEFLMEVQGDPTPAALQEAVNVIRHRLDALGTREISIVPEGKDRLKIQVPGLQGAEVTQMEKTLSQVAKLEFRLVPPNGREILSAAMANGGKLPYQYALDYEILPELKKDANGKDIAGMPVVIEKKAQLSGKHVTHAWRSIEQTGQSIVELEFDDEGKAQFASLTTANVKRDMAIVLDNTVRTVATIQEAMTNGRCQISGGDMSAAECDELSSVLMNPLETPIKMLSTSSVDASLGADQIQSGLHAGLIALALVVTFMVLYYLVSGVIAVLSLSVNLVLLFGLLAQFHFTLTLPGIAGIVLTIGMAVDANVLIYERIRDELANGKPARTAIDTGFEKAFSAIFDSNVTTLIPAVVLAYFGTGPLRGFAVTLVLGIVANLFAALVVTRNAYDWILTATDRPNLRMMQFIKSPRFDFLKLRHAGLIFSLLIIGAGAATVAMKGEALLGVDFKGGDAVLMTYTQPVELSQMRDALLKGGIQDPLLQPVSGANAGSYALQLQTEQNTGAKAAEVLARAFPQANFVAKSVDKIGAQVGRRDEAQGGARRCWLGLFGILVYAAIRFEWSYALAAAVGQLHDVLVALSRDGAARTRVDAAAGRRVADDCGLLDQRQDRGLRPHPRRLAALREKGSFYEVINRSLNLTLARTIIDRLHLSAGHPRALIHFRRPGNP